MLLTISAAAKKIGVHQQTLKVWSLENRGPEFTRTAGGHRRYDEVVLDRWVQSTVPTRVPTPA